MSTYVLHEHIRHIERINLTMKQQQIEGDKELADDIKKNILYWFGI